MALWPLSSGVSHRLVGTRPLTGFPGVHVEGSLCPPGMLMLSFSLKRPLILCPVQIPKLLCLSGLVQGH